MILIVGLWNVYVKTDARKGHVFAGATLPFGLSNAYALKSTPSDV